MKRKIAVIILFILGIFGAVAAETEIFVGFEKDFALFINPNAETSVFFRIFTEIGEFYTVVSLIVILLIFKNRLRLGVPVLVSTSLSFLSGELLKRIVARPRPDEAIRLLEITGFSFPSGHALNAAALYTAIIYCALKLLKTKAQKAVCAACLVTVAFLIGFSRLYFNVHYLTDVLSGFCIGTAMSLMICPWMLRLADKKGKGEVNASV